MARPVPSKEELAASVRWMCSDPRGRRFLQWLLNKEADVEMPMSASTFEHDESRRELGRKIRRLIADTFSRSRIIEIEEEQHGR